jgi:hypothetical protein
MLKLARIAVLILTLVIGVLPALAQTKSDNKTSAHKVATATRQEIRKADSIARAILYKDSLVSKNRLIDSTTLKQAFQQTLKNQQTTFQNGKWNTDGLSLSGFETEKSKLSTAEPVARLDVDELKESGKRIYSHAGLRKLYDSLGISKLDTLLALASARQNVTEDELLRSVISSFPGANSNKPGAPTDLSKLNVLSAAGKELPPIAGFKTPSAYGLIMDSLKHAIITSFKRDQLKTFYQQKLDSLSPSNNLIAQTEQYRTKWDSLSAVDMKLVANMEVPQKYQHLIDSMKSTRSQNWDVLDSLSGQTDLISKLEKIGGVQQINNRYRLKWDSISEHDPRLMQQMMVPRKYQLLIDSLQTDGMQKWERLDSLSGAAGLKNKLEKVGKLQRIAKDPVKWDSLQDLGNAQLKASLIKRYRNSLDSLNTFGDSTFVNSKLTYAKKLDSIRQIADKAKIRIQEEKIDKDFKTVLLRNKPDFLQRINFEGVLGILTNQDSAQILQFSPAIDLSFGKSFTVGAGPNLIWAKTQNTFRFYGGYRIFGKYYFLKQRVYAQLEDSVEPGRIRLESASSTTHSMLAGMGGLLKVSESMSINVAILYRVNNAQYSSNLDSPFVFRIGLSSIKSISNE